jgi:hypothetical protein
MNNPQSGPSKTKLPEAPASGGGPIYWRKPAYEGDRHLAMCGSVTVGAVFPPIGKKHWRWRVWFGATVHPWEGKAKTEEQARAEVVVHFQRFLEQAGLQMRPQATEV